MGGDVLWAFECTPWRKVICRNQRRQEKSLVGTACDCKCVSTEQKVAGNEFRRNCCWRKMLSWKSGNPRMWESVRCDAVLCCVQPWCDVLFPDSSSWARAKDLSSAVGRDIDYSCNLQIKASRGLWFSQRVTTFMVSNTHHIGNASAS